MKKKLKKQIRFYFFGSLFILGCLALGVYYNSSNPLADEVINYIQSKQEISDTLGPIKDIQTVSMPRFPSQNKTYSLKMAITGEKQNGELRLTASYQNKGWKLSQIKLFSKNLTLPLNPLYVDLVTSYAASTSSAPLKEPVFLAGEDIFLRIGLKGFSPDNKNSTVVESLTLYNQNNELIKHLPAIADYKHKNTKAHPDQISFTNKISSLPQGSYFALFRFNSQKGEPLETFWQPLKIRAPQKTIYVKSVKYFEDQDREKAVEPAFSADQKIYLRLLLDGFKVQDQKIAGTVDLKVTNSKGDIVAFKPKFASFNQNYQDDKNIVIDGDLKLNDPDVYFLSFKIRDFFLNDSITHDEKVIVHLATQPES